LLETIKTTANIVILSALYMINVWDWPRKVSNYWMKTN